MPLYFDKKLPEILDSAIASIIKIGKTGNEIAKINITAINIEKICDFLRLPIYPPSVPL